MNDEATRQRIFEQIMLSPINLVLWGLEQILRPLAFIERHTYGRRLGYRRTRSSAATEVEDDGEPEIDDEY